MLALAGIPLLAEQRDERHPLIIAGGPCTFNPEPVAPFFDAMVIGEGEEVVLELCTAYLNGKHHTPAKQSFWMNWLILTEFMCPHYFGLIITLTER